MSVTAFLRALRVSAVGSKTHRGGAESGGVRKEEWVSSPRKPSLPARLVAEFEELVGHYPERKAALIPALHRCQDELGGWLTPDTLEACAEFFGLEPVEVFGVASFYPMFHLHPVGEHVVGCATTSPARCAAPRRSSARSAA